MKQLWSKTNAFIAAAPFLLAARAEAALPTTGYAFDIGIVVGLIVGTIAFLVVANNCIGVYKEIGTGKRTWGDLGSHGAFGVLLLVFVVYLLTEAASIIFDGGTP
jgi:integrating conjugative element membrane protein (TIGR03745 family)